MQLDTKPIDQHSYKKTPSDKQSTDDYTTTYH